MDETVIKNAIQLFLSPEKAFYKYDRHTSTDTVSYWDKLLELALEYPDTKSLVVDFKHIKSFDPVLADELINNPQVWLRAANLAIAEMSIPIDKELKDVDIRIVNVPLDYEIPISKLRDIHVGKFVTLRGVINKTTQVLPVYKYIAYLCLRCGHVTGVEQSTDSDVITEPFACDSETCGKRGPFKIIHEQSKTYNHQYLKLQEPLESLRGKQPEFIVGSCINEIAGIRFPGEKVVVNGVLNTKMKISKQGKTPNLDFVYLINSITLSQTDYENLEISPTDIEKIIALAGSKDAKKLMIKSIAPSIYGNDNIKEGILLQQFSGVRVDLKDGTHKRGDIHIMICGDPGTAKSQLLKNAAFIAPRAVQVSGKSSTAAGLTGAAVRDEFSGRWSIEAGALTMAGEGGLCVLDEADKMSSKDRASIHDALEQQFIHIAKAGVLAEMPTACSLLAAANPKNGKYNKYDSIVSQFDMDPAFISRIDLLYVLQDTPNDREDSRAIRHVLEQYYDDSVLLTTDFLRKYIAYAKINYKPELTAEAKDAIHDFYVSARSSSNGNQDSVPVSLRVGDSLIRLASANAKLRLSHKVEKIDVVEAVRLLSSNLKVVGVDPQTGEMDASYLEFGISGSQRHHIRDISNIINKLISKDIMHESAKIDDVITEANDFGIENPEFYIKKMLERGLILKTRPNYIRTI